MVLYNFLRIVRDAAMVLSQLGFVSSLTAFFNVLKNKYMFALFFHMSSV